MKDKVGQTIHQEVGLQEPKKEEPVKEQVAEETEKDDKPKIKVVQGGGMEAAIKGFLKSAKESDEADKAAKAQ